MRHLMRRNAMWFAKLIFAQALTLPKMNNLDEYLLAIGRKICIIQ